jgi:hypothetical protein
VYETAVVSIDATTFNAAETSAVTLLAAPAAGSVHIIDEVQIFLDYAAAFTGGSDVVVRYNTSNVLICDVDATAFTGVADTHVIAKPNGYHGASGALVADVTASAAKAVELFVSGTTFADGAGSVVKVKLRYHTVTLMT